MRQQGNNQAVIPSNVEGSRFVSCHSRITCEDLNTGGFTLVELAIALMVIGLLIGGVLKGQELIENARMTRMIKDLKDFETAVMIFRSTYNELPGDMRKPERLPNCNAAPCNIVAATAGNGQIHTHAKSAQFWRHLFHAGLIANINEDTDNPDNLMAIAPLNPFDNHISVYYSKRRDVPELSSTNRFFMSDGSGNRFSILRSATLDSKMDDGKPRSGMVQAQEPDAPVYTGVQCYNPDAPETYWRSNKDLRCTIGINSDMLN